MTAAVPVTVHCPACRAHVNTQAGSYAFARAYLCPSHTTLWDAEDARQHQRSKACPWSPQPCTRCRIHTANSYHEKAMLNSRLKGGSNVPTEE